MNRLNTNKKGPVKLHLSGHVSADCKNSQSRNDKTTLRVKKMAIATKHFHFKKRRKQQMLNTAGTHITVVYTV